MDYVKYKGADNSLICGDVLRRNDKELLVFNMAAKAGSRNLFWLPASSCVPVTLQEVLSHQQAVLAGGVS